MGLLDIQDVIPKRIDGLRFPTLADALEVVLVALMHMPVHEKARLIPVDQVEEHLKAGVRQIGVIAQLIGGRVREQDVKALAAPELEAQTAHAALHLVLGVHVQERFKSILKF